MTTTHIPGKRSRGASIEWEVPTQPNGVHGHETEIPCSAIPWCRRQEVRPTGAIKAAGNRCNCIAGMDRFAWRWHLRFHREDGCGDSPPVPGLGCDRCPEGSSEGFDSSPTWHQSLLSKRVEDRCLDERTPARIRHKLRQVMGLWSTSNRAPIDSRSTCSVTLCSPTNGRAIKAIAPCSAKAHQLANGAGASPMVHLLLGG